MTSSKRSSNSNLISSVDEDAKKRHTNNRRESPLGIMPANETYTVVEEEDDEGGEEENEFNLFGIGTFDDYFREEPSKKSLKTHFATVSERTGHQIAVNGQRMGLILPKVV